MKDMIGYAGYTVLV